MWCYNEYIICIVKLIVGEEVLYLLVIMIMNFMVCFLVGSYVIIVLFKLWYIMLYRLLLSWYWNW